MPIQSYSNGTVQNGGASMGASDATFERGMIGAELYVYAGDAEEEQTLEIATITSATQVSCTATWAGASQTGDVEMTVTQDRWLLPDGLESGVEKMWRLAGLYPDLEGQPSTGRPYDNPRDYTVEDLDGGGALRLCFRGGARAATYHLKYWADLEALATLDDEIGGDTGFQRLVRLKMLERVFGLDPGTFEKPSRYTVRLAQVKKEFDEVLRRERGVSAEVTGPVTRMNRPQFWI